jgi:hypothetical protein
MRKFCLMLCILVPSIAFSFSVNDYKLFDGMEIKYEDLLMTELDRGFNVQSDADIKTTCSALKRIGELKLTNARPKIMSLSDSVSPESATEGLETIRKLRAIYYMSIIVMGQIGAQEEANRLARYLRTTKDRQAKIFLIQSLGRLRYKISVETLNDFTEGQNNTDMDIPVVLIDALVNLGSKSSIPYLRSMQVRGNFTDKDTIKKFDDAVDFLEKNAK